MHGLVLAGESQRIERDVLALAATNSVTGLGAEFIGRAYGGGLLKLEPREAGRLPVPEIALVSRHAQSLKRRCFPMLGRCLPGERTEMCVAKSTLHSGSTPWSGKTASLPSVVPTTDSFSGVVYGQGDDYDATTGR